VNKTSPLRRLLLSALLSLAASSALAKPPSPPDPDLPLLHAQVQQARHALAQDERLPRVVYVGAALDAASTAFVGDVKLATRRLKALAPQMASLSLGNGGDAPDAWPQATLHTMPAALAQAGELLRTAPAADRLAIVLLSSHGNRGFLALSEDGGDEFDEVTAAMLKRWLAPLGDTPTLLVISACHAGSLIPALQAPHRIIFAAARADRSSFGCEAESTNTYFVDELFTRLDDRLSLEDWFARTVAGVSAREKRMGLSPPSRPQLSIGRAMRTIARQPLVQWLGR
jgi:hypothetical protein